MAKPHRNQKGGENPIKKWWCCCCGKSVNKRFEDLIQTIANGEEGCDDETKWKLIVSNKGKYEANLYLLHCRTQRMPVITRRIEEVVISLSFKEMNEFWIIRSVLWKSIEWEWLSQNVPLVKLISTTTTLMKKNLGGGQVNLFGYFNVTLGN